MTSATKIKNNKMIVKVSEAREIEIVKIYLGVNLKLELIKNDDGNHYYNCIMNPFQEDDIATITAYKLWNRQYADSSFCAISDIAFTYMKCVEEALILIHENSFNNH